MKNCIKLDVFMLKVINVFSCMPAIRVFSCTSQLQKTSNEVLAPTYFRPTRR